MIHSTHFSPFSLDVKAYAFLLECIVHKENPSNTNVQGALD